MSQSIWDMHDDIEEQLTAIGLLPDNESHELEEIWAAFDKLVERYQEAMKLLTDVINSYETEGCDGCGTIDQYLHNTVVRFIYSEENNAPST